MRSNIFKIGANSVSGANSTHRSMARNSRLPLCKIRASPVISSITPCSIVLRSCSLSLIIGYELPPPVLEALVPLAKLIHIGIDALLDADRGVVHVLLTIGKVKLVVVARPIADLIAVAGRWWPSSEALYWGS
jgi:hypothetical protein